MVDVVGMDLDLFAADRSRRLEANDADLEPVVRDGLTLYPNEGWQAEIIEAAQVLWLESFEASGGDPSGDEVQSYLDDWAEEMTEALSQIGDVADPPEDVQVQRVSYWLSTSAANGGTQAALDGSAGTSVWVTMRDANVRDTHRGADGQQRSAGATFDIGGYDLLYPGQPVGPPEIWINCRCLLAPAPNQEGVVMTRAISHTPTPRDVFAGADDTDQDEAPVIDEPDGAMQWYGVLAPEGVPTGDGRMFGVESLRNRDLPIPLRYVRSDVGGHDTAVIVANIQRIWREGNLVMGAGEFNDLPEATEAVEQIAGGFMRGVSVDLDDAMVEYAADDRRPGEEIAVITDGRISAATLVAIPAFQEAYVTLGTPEEGAAEAVAAGCLPCQAREAARQAGLEVGFADESVSDKAWSDFTQADYSDDQWYRATVLHANGDSRVKSDNKLPIREPDGTLNRNAVHAAAARFNQTEGPAEAKSAAAAALRGAYDTLGEDPPEVIAASADALVFADSVAVGDRVSWTEFVAADEVERTGTVTEVDGDTAEVRGDHDDEDHDVPVADLTVIESGSPEGMTASQFAPGTRDGPGWLTNPDDSQRLRDYWARGPGAAKIRWGQPGDFNRCRRQLAKYIKNPQWLAGTCANLHKVAIGVWPGQESAGDTVAASAFTIVASVDAAPLQAPTGWFDDPQLDGPTNLHVGADGRVFGHVARWSECHIGYGDVCKVAPRSTSGYSMFLLGSYLTAEGDVLPVGTITMNTGHADTRPGVGAAAAMAHYDNTGTAAAYINVGEDEHGIWCAGVLAPGLDEDDKVKLRGAKISGDWRPVGAGLEMVGALAVNIPGFPVPHVALAASGGVQTALVAAGIVDTEPAAEPQQWDMASVVAQTVATVRQMDRRVAMVNAAREVIRAEQTAKRRRLVAIARAALDGKD